MNDGALDSSGFEDVFCSSEEVEEVPFEDSEDEEAWEEVPVEEDAELTSDVSSPQAANAHAAVSSKASVKSNASAFLIKSYSFPDLFFCSIHHPAGFVKTFSCRSGAWR